MKDATKKTDLLYNEFIVYDVAQVIFYIFVKRNINALPTLINLFSL